MGPLTKLPCELHQMILAEISSPQDLYNYIRTSRIIYHSFIANPDKFILLMLKNSIHTVARPWALALNLVPVKKSGTVVDDIGAFLTQDFGGSRPVRQFPTDRASLVALALQNGRINRFIQHFVYKALYGTPTWSSTIDPWELELELQHNLNGPVTEDDREPGTLPYWATLNHEHKQACKSREIQAIASLTSMEMARLQRAFYAYEFYCQVVQPTTMNVDGFGSLLSDQQQYDWLLSPIPSFQIEEILSVHQYYVSIAGKLFDQNEDKLVKEVLSLPHTALQPIPLDEARLRVALYSGGQTDFRELQDRLAKMGESTSHLGSTDLDFPEWPDQIYFLSSAASLPSTKPKGFLRFASQRNSQRLGPYCNGSQESARDEAIVLGSKGAMYIEKVLCSSEPDCLKLLRQDLGSKRSFLADACWNYLGTDTSRSSDADEVLDRPSGDSAEFPNLGWYVCRQVPYSLFCYLYNPYREVGHVFWDAQRMIEEPLRSRLVEINNNFSTYIEKAASWPRRKERADLRLSSIMIKKEDMEMIIKKYRSTAREAAWESCAAYSFITL